MHLEQEKLPVRKLKKRFRLLNMRKEIKESAFQEPLSQFGHKSQGYCLQTEF